MHQSMRCLHPSHWCVNDPGEVYPAPCSGQGNADQESERPKGYAERYALALASRRAPRGGTQQEGGRFLTRLTPQN